MKTRNFFVLLAIAAIPTSNVLAQNVTCADANTVVDFNFTGAEQSFTIPTPVAGGALSNIHIEAFGAEGADSAAMNANPLGGQGGLGGFAQGDSVRHLAQSSPYS